MLAGGVAYIGSMVYHGVWETGSKIKSSMSHDILISVVCSGGFTVMLICCYLRLGADTEQVVHFSIAFFIGIFLKCLKTGDVIK